jgi:hypothetical protein
MLMKKLFLLLSLTVMTACSGAPFTLIGKITPIDAEADSPEDEASLEAASPEAASPEAASPTDAPTSIEAARPDSGPIDSGPQDSPTEAPSRRFCCNGNPCGMGWTTCLTNIYPYEDYCARVDSTCQGQTCVLGDTLYQVLPCDI